MRIYSFEYGNGVDEPLDREEDITLPDMEVAKAHARRGASTIMARIGGDLKVWSGYFVAIEDDQGQMTTENFPGTTIEE